jgi:undecaprenyl-diphosphatase UppP
MNFFQAIFLGLVQALTEYLPVSSSAHIRIIGDLMLGHDPGAAFTAIIQFGTEFAVLLYFRHDIARILSHWFGCLFGRNGKDLKSRMGSGDKDASLGWYIIIGTIPIVLAGVLFKSTIETTLRNLWITVTVLIVFGVLLWIADARSRQVKTIDDMNTKEAIAFGIGQMLALIPGVSRSGGTITFGRAMGYTREAAVRVSFLMAIPGRVRRRHPRSDFRGFRSERIRRGSDLPRLDCYDSRDDCQLPRGIRRDHRIPEVRLHLLVPRIRHLPHRAGRGGGDSADHRRTACRSRSVTGVRVTGC